MEYDWKREEFKENGFPEGRQIGIIAQEMEKEFPELVTTDNQGYKAIAYDRFAAVLLEAVKAQQKEIEVLKVEIQQLKGISGNGLNDRIKTLEMQVNTLMQLSKLETDK